MKTTCCFSLLDLFSILFVVVSPPAQPHYSPTIWTVALYLQVLFPDWADLYEPAEDLVKEMAERGGGLEDPGLGLGAIEHVPCLNRTRSKIEQNQFRG